ncbi:MAG: AAA family ATPase [Pseudomonadales bacterium]|nr:AAA family ATPase [Pseudomonadales bacterium]MBO7006188.1 AAA family ATPase [Pseudomonadales bacterium]
MPRAISLQGPQAVGKTTALKAIEKKLESTNVSYEIIRPIVERREEQQLNIFEQEGFVQNQKLFIEGELVRYATLPDGLTVFDRGPEDTECFSITFPKLIGQDWDIELLLSNELNRLRECVVESILYLTARDEVLLERKEADESRRRFSFNLEHFRLFESWYKKNPKVRFLDVSSLSEEDVENSVMEWIREFETDV